MKLAKAIEILQEILSRGSMIDDPDDTSSIKLGIEALKRVKEERAAHYLTDYELLPSEDPEIAPTRSLHHIKEVLESPLGKEPKG